MHSRIHAFKSNPKSGHLKSFIELTLLRQKIYKRFFVYFSKPEKLDNKREQRVRKSDS